MGRGLGYASDTSQCHVIAASSQRFFGSRHILTQDAYYTIVLGNCTSIDLYFEQIPFSV